MRKWLGSYLEVTKGEFNGLLLLIFCIGAVMVFPPVYDRLYPTDLKNPELLRELEKVERLAAADFQQVSATKRPERSPSRAPVQLKPFDPNQLDLAGWRSLGFSEKQAAVILKYQTRGGKFRRPEDVQKLYVVSPEHYQQLKPYIQIQPEVNARSTHAQLMADKTFPEATHNNAYKPAAPVMVELNAADTLELDRIKGIGPAFARRIVKYRERIGGFHKKEQLTEVYGIDSLKYREIASQVRVDPSLVRKLNVNTAGFEDMRKYPYLKYKQMNAILQYRQQHGNYANFEDLKKVAILDAETLERMVPYITF